MLIIVSIVNIAYKFRSPHGHLHGLAPITSLGSYEDGYVQGLDRLGIVKLPAHLLRPLSSPDASKEAPSGAYLGW